MSVKERIRSVLICVAFTALFVGFWNLFVFAYSTWITHSGFVFRRGENLLYPACLGIVVFLLLFMFGVFRKRK